MSDELREEVKQLRREQQNLEQVVGMLISWLREIGAYNQEKLLNQLQYGAATTETGEEIHENHPSHRQTRQDQRPN